LPKTAGLRQNLPQGRCGAAIILSPKKPRPHGAEGGEAQGQASPLGRSAAANRC